MDMEVVIEGVSDIVTKQIKRALRRVCRDGGRPGEWRVLVSPSEIRGEWDLVLYHGDGPSAGARRGARTRLLLMSSVLRLCNAARAAFAHRPRIVSSATLPRRIIESFERQHSSSCSESDGLHD